MMQAHVVIRSSKLETSRRGYQTCVSHLMNHILDL